MSRKVIDLTGTKIDYLTVISQELNPPKKYSNNTSWWICQCACGNFITISRDVLLNGRPNKSCGCLKKELVRQRATIHADSGTNFHKIWIGMKQRCLNQNSSGYHNYGGRGILVCEEWLNYENFKKDLYESYTQHLIKYGQSQTSLERIDNNGNYELSNCKWATRYEQQSNSRQNKWFEAEYTIPGDSFGYKEISNNQRSFARKYNLKKSGIYACLNGIQATHHGWSFQYLTNIQVQNLISKGEK